MSRRSFYALVALLSIAGFEAIAIAPAETLVVLSAGVPISILAAVAATVYLRRVYLRQRVPRSRFFRMLLELFAGLLLIGAWVGYLTVARLMERGVATGAIPWSLPAPAPTHSAPISALIVIAVFSSPVRFAWEVWTIRRRAQTEDPDGELDREE